MDGFPTESSDAPLTAEVAPSAEFSNSGTWSFMAWLQWGQQLRSRSSASLYIFRMAITILAIPNGMVAMVLTAVSYGRMAARSILLPVRRIPMWHAV